MNFKKCKLYKFEKVEGNINVLKSNSGNCLITQLPEFIKGQLFEKVYAIFEKIPLNESTFIATSYTSFCPICFSDIIEMVRKSKGSFIPMCYSFTESVNNRSLCGVKGKLNNVDVVLIKYEDNIYCCEDIDLFIDTNEFTVEENKQLAKFFYKNKEKWFSELSNSFQIFLQPKYSLFKEKQFKTQRFICYHLIPAYACKNKNGEIYLVTFKNLSTNRSIMLCNKPNEIGIYISWAKDIYNLVLSETISTGKLVFCHYDNGKNEKYSHRISICEHYPNDVYKEISISGSRFVEYGRTKDIAMANLLTNLGGINYKGYKFETNIPIEVDEFYNPIKREIINDSVVQIDYFETTGKGYLFNKNQDHILLGNHSSDYYITFDNLHVRLPEYSKDITISTKTAYTSRILTKDIKKFIDKYLLSGTHIPHSIIKIREPKDVTMDVLCDIEENCYISDGVNIYNVDVKSNIIENNYDIVYSAKQDKEIANYIWFNDNTFLSFIYDRLNSKIYSQFEAMYKKVYVTNYFIMGETETGLCYIYFNSQFDDKLNFISTDSTSEYYVSWANYLAIYIKNNGKIVKK